MPYKLSAKQLDGIKTQLELEVPFKTIAKSTPCSYAMVMEVRKNLQAWGTPKPPKLVSTGPKKLIRPNIEQDIVTQLTLDPTLYLDEIALYIKEKYTLDVNASTISRCLKAKGISKKVLQKRALERNQELRDYWMGRLTNWTASQMLFLDESAVNERSLERRKGWAPRGSTPYQALSFKRSERWSLLLCYGSRGFVCHDVIHGSYTAVAYNEFIVNEVLPRCNPFPGPNSVLCMDNARIHCTTELQAICEEAGVILAFLPPYSPDFSPVEEAFSTLKAWMRRHRELATLHTDLSMFLQSALAAFDGRVLDHFRSCHIRVEEDDN